MDKNEAINKVRQYKHLLQAYFDIDKVYLFGSYAKNNFHDDSDIDVAIVVNYLPEDYFSTAPLIWKLRRQVEDRIEPILIEKGKDKGGFLNEILKYGIEIN